MEEWLFTGPGQEKCEISLKYLISESKEAIRDFEVNVTGYKNQLEGKIETLSM